MSLIDGAFGDEQHIRRRVDFVDRARGRYNAPARTRALKRTSTINNTVLTPGILPADALAR
jgi:hypothetical protein